jgi:hypothetical protein
MSTYDSLPRFGINRLSFGGVRITKTPTAVRREYLFPVSKNRSKRIHKKLMKRFGRQWNETPCAYMVKGELFIHPTLYAELLDQVQDLGKRQAQNLFDMGQLNAARPATLTPEYLEEMSRKLTNAYPSYPEDRLVPRYNSER